MRTIANIWTNRERVGNARVIKKDCMEPTVTEK